MRDTMPWGKYGPLAGLLLCVLWCIRVTWSKNQQVACLRQEIVKKDQELAEQTEQVNSLQATVLRLGRELNTLKDNAASLNEAIRQKETTIASKDAEVHTLKQQVAALQHTVQQQAAAVHGANADIEQLHKSIRIAELPNPVKRLIATFGDHIVNKTVDELADSISDDLEDSVYLLDNVGFDNYSTKFVAPAKQVATKKAALALVLVYLHHMSHVEMVKLLSVLLQQVSGVWHTTYRKLFEAFGNLPVLHEVHTRITDNCNIQGQAKYKNAEVAAFLLLGRLMIDAHEHMANQGSEGILN